MLVERENALSALQAAITAADAGQGRVVFISGEAGIGKTSLLRALAAKTKARMLMGGCEALFTPRPLGPLHDFAGALDPELSALLESMASQERIFTALLGRLQRPGAFHAIVLEDIHWADNATLDLIKYLGRRIPHLRAALILSFRTEDVSFARSLAETLGDLPAGSIVRIPLAPLSEAGVEAMSRLAGREAGKLHSTTGGNPFFVTELLASQEPLGTLPASVRDAVWARFARLTPKEQALLESISIAPGSVEDWLAHGLAGYDARAEIDSCVSRGLLVRGNHGSLRFRHELARVATLERVPQGAQRQLHAKAGVILGSHSGAALSRLAHHAEGAGDSAGVLSFAPRAAAEAASLGAHREAAAHYRTALDHADGCEPELLARLLEDWSHESGLALEIDDAIIDARKRAVEIWRALGRRDKVILNLRWISRLHWLRGEAGLVNQYLDAAIAEAEGLPPSHEAAMAMSARSQVLLINDYYDEAIHWGLKALAMAEAIGDMDTRIHSLNNVGAARMFSGRPGGEPMMEESIALALAHGYHEHAARGFTNYTGYAIDNRLFGLAGRYAPAGIEFTRQHDLDAELHYLIGLHAELLLEQGRFAEADAEAESVLRLKHVSLVCRFPALLVQAKIRMRRGGDAADQLAQALADAISTGEPQNILPVRFARAEAAWLSGELDRCQAELSLLAEARHNGFDTWRCGELAVWWGRAGMAEPFPLAGEAQAAPYAADAADDFEKSARLWQAIGAPYEAALALMRSPETLPAAMPLLRGLGATATEKKASSLAKAWGIALAGGGARRGPYGPAKAHPLGLTRREVEVLVLMTQGLGNADIARRLNRSQRTVEHHASAVLGKLGAANRMDAVLRVAREPSLLESAGDGFKNRYIPAEN